MHVFSSKSICVNCGGRGGKPGPCPTDIAKSKPVDSEGERKVPKVTHGDFHDFNSDKSMKLSPAAQKLVNSPEWTKRGYYTGLLAIGGVRKGAFSNAFEGKAKTEADPGTADHMNKMFAKHGL